MAFLYGAEPVDMDAALDQLRAARDQGVLLVRDLGAHDRLSLKLPEDPALPRVIGAGQPGGRRRLRRGQPRAGRAR